MLVLKLKHFLTNSIPLHQILLLPGLKDVVMTTLNDFN